MVEVEIRLWSSVKLKGKILFKIATRPQMLCGNQMLSTAQDQDEHMRRMRGI